MESVAQMKEKLNNWQAFIENLTREKDFSVKDDNDGNLLIISRNQAQLTRINHFLRSLTPEIFEQTRVYQLQPATTQAPVLPIAGSQSTLPNYEPPQINNASIARQVFSSMFQEEIYATLDINKIFPDSNRKEPDNISYFKEGKLCSAAVDTKYVYQIWGEMLKNIYSAHNKVTIEQARAALHGHSLAFQDDQITGKEIKTFLNECFYLVTFYDQQSKQERVRIVIHFARYIQFLWAPQPEIRERQSEYMLSVNKEHFIAFIRALSGGTLLEIVDPNPNSNQLNVSPLVLTNTPPVARKVNFVLVVDCSGSMQDCFAVVKTKLYEMRDTLMHIFPNAYLEVIFFNTQLSFRFKYAVINKGDLERDIDNIQADGNTAFYACLEKILNDIHAEEMLEQTNRIVLVISDGQDTIKPKVEFPAAKQSLVQSLIRFEMSSRTRPRVITIGIGEHYMKDEMESLARVTHSRHYPIAMVDINSLLSELLSPESLLRISNTRQIVDLIIKQENQQEHVYHIEVEPTGTPQKPNIVVPIRKDKPCKIVINRNEFHMTVQLQKINQPVLPVTIVNPPVNMNIKWDDLNLDKDELGRGGFGKVYRAKWQGKEVAAKVLLATHFSNDAIKNLKDEVERMNMVGRSDFVVHVQGLCIDPPHFCMVMELKKGGDLSKLLRSGKPLDWTLRMTYAKQITMGLNFIHQYMLHRDLKSLNVLLNEDQTVAAVSDFGLALPKTKSMGPSMAIETVNQYGTPYWMAPEALTVIADYAEYSKATDVYSLGMLFYELAERHYPFEGIEPAIVVVGVTKGERPQFADESKIPVGFAKLIKLCWDQNPIFRPETKKIIQDLDGCISEHRIKN